MQAQVKGALFGSVVRVLQQLHEPPKAQAVLDALDGEFGERLRANGIVASSWYPIAWNVQILKTLDRVLERDVTYNIEIARRCVVNDMQGIYRLFVKMISPEMLMSWGPRTFGQYYRGGSVDIVESQQGRTVVRYSGWDGFEEPLWYAVIGGCAGGLEACGATAVKGEIVGGGRGSEARMAFTWRLDKK